MRRFQAVTVPIGVFALTPPTDDSAGIYAMLQQLLSLQKIVAELQAKLQALTNGNMSLPMASVSTTGSQNQGFSPSYFPGYTAGSSSGSGSGGPSGQSMMTQSGSGGSGSGNGVL